MNVSNARLIKDAWGQLIRQRQRVDSHEEDLKRKWVELGNPISFAGVNIIYNYYKGELSREKIEEVLSTIPTYSLFKEKRRNKLYNAYFIYYKHQIWNLDLVYVRRLKDSNDGVSYLLTLLESFSRKLFIIAMKDRSSISTLNGFKRIH